jgi:flavin reductase (DIM6/NTAB) family NADH-FMN oxidoreductase RutF
MNTRRIIDPATSAGIYSILGALVVPRPIAWVSTRSADGVENLAPHSFFQIVSTSPPIVMISTMGEKDTARNARETGELVVCGAPVNLIEQINLSGVEFPADRSEFVELGLTSESSERVAPPRVAQSPYALECRVVDIIEMGNGVLIFGEVVLVAIEEDMMEGACVRAQGLDLISRLGGNAWGEIGTQHDVPRVTWEQYQETIRP